MKVLVKFGETLTDNADGNPELAGTRKSSGQVQRRYTATLRWVRESPDHKQLFKLAVKTVVGKKILWAYARPGSSPGIPKKYQINILTFDREWR